MKNRIELYPPSDFQPFAKLTSDPRVMEFFPATLTQAESDANIELMKEKIKKDGFCFWATELKTTHEFIGFIGLNIPGFQTHFTPFIISHCTIIFHEDFTLDATPKVIVLIQSDATYST